MFRLIVYDAYYTEMRTRPPRTRRSRRTRHQRDIIIYHLSVRRRVRCTCSVRRVRVSVYNTRIITTKKVRAYVYRAAAAAEARERRMTIDFLLREGRVADRRYYAAYTVVVT